MVKRLRISLRPSHSRLIELFNFLFWLFRLIVMKCPYCHHRESWKMMRRRWMRVTPGHMRNMRCSNCGAEFIQWMRTFPLTHQTAHRMVSIYHGFLWVLLCLALGFGVPFLFQILSTP